MAEERPTFEDLQRVGAYFGHDPAHIEAYWETYRRVYKKAEGRALYVENNQSRLWHEVDREVRRMTDPHFHG
jgi:hypothetical protein